MADREALIQRLIEEKEAMERPQTYFDLGHTKGLEDAETLSYKAYSELEGIVDFDGDLRTLPDEAGAKLVPQMAQSGEEDPDFDDEQFIAGWYAAVMEVWDEVKDEVHQAA